MTFIQTCPAPVALTAATEVTCSERFGQVLKLCFQRTGTNFADAAAIALLANWTVLLAAVDETKAIQAPINENLVFPVSAGIFDGGDDNTTPQGQPLLLGGSNVPVEGRYRDLPALNKTQLDDLQQEALLFNRLGVYLINEDGDFIANNVTGTELGPFPINGYFLSAISSEGYNAPNFNTFNWSFAFNWSDDFQIIKQSTMDFDPRTFF